MRPTSERDLHIPRPQALPRTARARVTGTGSSWIPRLDAAVSRLDRGARRRDRRSPAGPPRASSRGAAPEGEPSSRQPQGARGSHSTVHVTRDRWRNWARHAGAQPARIYSDRRRRAPLATHLADLGRSSAGPARGAWASACSARRTRGRASSPATASSSTTRMIGASGDRTSPQSRPAGPAEKPRVTVPPGITLRGGFLGSGTRASHCRRRRGPSPSTAWSRSQTTALASSQTWPTPSSRDLRRQARRGAPLEAQTATADELAATSVQPGAALSGSSSRSRSAHRGALPRRGPSLPRPLRHDTDRARPPAPAARERLSVPGLLGALPGTAARASFQTRNQTDVWSSPRRGDPEGARARTAPSALDAPRLIDVRRCSSTAT